MITFGELRRLSLEWQADIGAVERVYALDWLLKGLFESESLRPNLALRGPAALSKAYFADYPQPEDADLMSRGSGLETDLADAAQAAGRESGLNLRLISFRETQARFEYTGPLGRRSAAQPHVTLRFYPFSLKLPARERPLLHPFREQFNALVYAEGLEEMTADYLVAWSGRPRARDVYDLHSILSHTQELDRSLVRSLARERAAHKGVELREKPDRAYLPVLERAWDSALKNVGPKPPFQLAEAEVEREIAVILG